MRCSKDVLPGNSSGFTLIELLLALIIFGIIAAVVFASFSAISTGVEKGREKTELYQVGRGALQRLAQEIASAYRFHQTDCDEESPTYICEPLKSENGETDGIPRDRLTFLAIPYRQFPEGVLANEVCDICYYIDRNAQGTVALFRYEDCTLDSDDIDRCSGERKPLELTDGVVGLDVTFYDAESESHDSWPPDDPDGSLPCRVRVEITLRQISQRFATTVWLPLGNCKEDEG